MSGPWPSVRYWDTEWERRALATNLGPTHGGLGVDRAGRIYASTDGERSIIVFDPDGTALHSFDRGLAGIHAITVVEQDGAEWLLCAHLTTHRVVLLDLDGTVRWSTSCPEPSGLYRDPSAYKPTAAVLGPDGCLFVADGYGASVIHKFDPQRRYMKSFGGPDAGPGCLRNCHGLALDQRGVEPRLLICDRRNRRLVHYDLEGRFVGVVAADLRRPCAVAFHGDLVAVAELEGRVSVLDARGQVVRSLGDNPDARQWAQYDLPASAIRPGVFAAPHAVAFDYEGRLYVSEWNHAGRLSRLSPDPP